MARSTTLHATAEAAPGESLADRMAGALMEAITRLRADRRVESLPVGSTARRGAIRRHLRAVAAAWGVDRRALTMEIAAALEGTDRAREAAESRGAPTPEPRPTL